MPRIAPRTIALATVALAALVLVPAAASASLVPVAFATQRVKPVIDTKLKNRLLATGKRAKKLSADQKTSLTNSFTGAALQVTPPSGRSNLFTNNAVSDVDGLVAYFIGEKLSMVYIGLPFLNDAVLAKELQFVGAMFPNSEISKVVDETSAMIATGKYDQKKVEANLSMLIGAFNSAYGEKSTSAAFNYTAGSLVGFSTTMAHLMGASDADLKKAAMENFATLQGKIKEHAKKSSGDLEAGPKDAFTELGGATIADRDSALTSIKAVDNAYYEAIKAA